MIGRGHWAAAAMLVAALATVSGAQPPTPAVPRPMRLVVAGGAIMSGGQSLGDRGAELRRNSTGTPPPFTLFRADSHLENAAGFEARVGYVVTRFVTVEVGGTYATPRLAVAITGDAEADAATVAEEVSQYTVDVSGVVQLPWPALGRRATTYAIGGGGYVRQLHEDRLLVETGRSFHVGGGVRYWFRGGSGRGRALGVRGDARYVRQTRGIDFEDKPRSYPSVSLLGLVGF
jgi:hypothetical protein